MVAGSRASSEDESSVAGESPIARIVREAIEAVAAPDVRQQIMHRALHMAHEHRMPTSGAPLHDFIDRHLRSATAFYLGNEAAESIMTNVEPLISLAEKIAARSPHRSSDEREPTQRVGRERQYSGVSPKTEVEPEDDTDTSKYPRLQAQNAALPMVFVATRSEARWAGIAETLEAVAAVQQIEDVVAFLDNLKATASLSPLLVIDCVEASVQPSTIATLADELPKGSGVLLWGATDQHQHLVEAATRDRGWLRCEPETPPKDVAILIEMLLTE
ncbi:MAG: hypothetical protein AAGF92_10955 [Myxococcota bacterium]